MAYIILPRLQHPAVHSITKTLTVNKLSRKLLLPSTCCNPVGVSKCLSNVHDVKTSNKYSRNTHNSVHGLSERRQVELSSLTRTQGQFSNRAPTAFHSKILLRSPLQNPWLSGVDSSGLLVPPYVDESRRHFTLNPRKIVEQSPKHVRPYLQLIRFDKPIGSWLLFWPCAWSIGMAATPGQFPDFGLLFLFGLGSVIMRGAGCTINDLWDRDIDKKVARTRSRPLASGKISKRNAVLFLGAQLSAALCILLSLNSYSVLLGFSSMLLVSTYPLFKRVTYWPQVVLGLTINWGALLGWAAVKGSCDWSVVLPLYLGAAAWTMVYDTIYAHQDKADDMLIGVKSTALRFGEDTRAWLSGFSAAMVLGLLLSGLMCEQTWPYYAAVGLTGAHLYNQVATAKFDKPEDCWKKFSSNKRLGAIIFAGIVAGTILKGTNSDKEESTDAANKNL
ncbi:4-hydroxybenzoate polyprenyltransferase, mitochondrial-like [Branchiostoma floridae]|uniref:4-hydroxybenzoate polyprenyltransferase, mitochondrial n=1 Tax=Branchiostoma floridae TaxID=7739 RepID=A0A9J7LHW2_BRAFL|nr:4-hydroxybenzoate polyprenyltransferase, mitochondrial-like [Branchiostoma floridae]